MSSTTPQVFAKFIEKPIIAENGRLVFALVNAFASNGYSVKLYENTDFRELGPPGRLIYSIGGVEMTKTEPQSTEDKIYLFDKQDKSCARENWRKRIQVKFDVFSGYAMASYRGKEPIIMPYPMHPWHYGPDLKSRLRRARSTEKRVRIFFSGDTEGYKRNRIMYPKPKLTRTQVVETILGRASSRTQLVQDQATLEGVFEGKHRDECVIVDMGKVFVEDWLNNIAKADFFICPPGYVMPMCHNAVEAMAVGTIPIINYPEWFTPSLEHLKTCIAFDDEKDLLRKIDQALEMEPEAIESMRRNVIEYYEKHLDQTPFIKQIEARRESDVTVLMITDGCVVRSAPQLNGRSILIRDTPVGEMGVFDRVLTGLFSSARGGVKPAQHR